MTNVILLSFNISLIILISHFLNVGKIEGGHYVKLFGIIIFCSLAFYGFDRLKEVDLKNLTLKLAELKEVRKDIYAAKKDVEEMAKNILEISYILADGSGRWGGIPEEHLKEINRIRDQLFKFLSISTEELKEIENRINSKIEEINKEINNRPKNKVN